MLVNIEAFLLNTLADTQTVELFDAEKEQAASRNGPEVNDRDAKGLHTEEVPAAAIEETTVRSQQARHERTEDTADTVHAGGAHRVVDMQLTVNELDGVDQHDAADQADDDRTERRHHVATRRDTDQTGQDTVERQGEGRFAIL